MKKKVIIWVLVVIIFSNLPLINKEILRIVDREHFRYSNEDASFTRKDYFDFKSGVGSKTLDQESIRISLKSSDEEVYRLYRINPLCFWRWTHYLMVSKQYKYKSWEEIEPNRVPYDPNSPVQKF